jgi:hypothetical protein
MAHGRTGGHPVGCPGPPEADVQARPAAGWDTLDMRRLLPAGLLLVALVPLSACSGSDATTSAGTAGSSASGSPGASASTGTGTGAAVVASVREAAKQSTQAGSSRFALRNATVVQGQTIAVTGSGAFDYARHEGTLALTLPGGSVEQRVVGGKVYLALSQQPGTFYALTLDQVQGTSLGASSDPSASFASLSAASDDVRAVGQERLRDAVTTHYRGTVDVKKALAQSTGAARQVAQATLARSGLARLPFDAWVDDEGRLRKYVQRSEVPASDATGGRPVQSTTTLELFDYGVDVAVTAPPAASVKDGAPLLAALGGRATS